MNWLKEYGTTEGPLGFPMIDAEAKSLEDLLKSLPEQDYQKVKMLDCVTEKGDRNDVSWITTECNDRDKEVVISSGFKDDYFSKNPIVTLNHDYKKQPVGKSLWRRRVREGKMNGVKAKTVYPEKPAEWKGDEPWAPDVAFALIKAGLMLGKSIGFLTIKSHSPTEDEVKKNPEWAGCRRIIEEWQLLEYGCTWLPVNPECVTEAVSKSIIKPEELKAFGIEYAPPPEPVFAFTPLEEFERALNREMAKIDGKALVEKLVKEASAKVMGRI